MTVIKMKKVDIEVEQKDGSILEEQFTVRRLRFDQIVGALDEVHEVYDIIMNDPNLQSVFKELFDGDTVDVDPDVWDKFTEDEKKEVILNRKANSENKFMEGVMKSFPVLLVRLPKKAGDLLSAMSRMDRDLLGQQELETVMEIYDAVLKVNDMETLLERGKKSLEETKRSLGWLNLTRKATGQTKH